MKKTICGFASLVMVISMCVLNGAAADDPGKAY
jgi:hypothetical protein